MGDASRDRETGERLLASRVDAIGTGDLTTSDPSVTATDALRRAVERLERRIPKVVGEEENK